MATIIVTERERERDHVHLLFISLSCTLIKRRFFFKYICDFSYLFLFFYSSDDCGLGLLPVIAVVDEVHISRTTVVDVATVALILNRR